MPSFQAALPRSHPRIGYIALGSNLDDATRTSREVLDEALGLLDEPELRITRQSKAYRSPAFPAGNGPDYVNAVAEISTTLPAEAVLAALHDVENTLGRTRGARWASRVIDLDLLALGSDVLPDRLTFAHWAALPLSEQMAHTPSALILPHPRLQDRAFVLVPLVEIAPEWVHPVLGKTASQLLATLPEAGRADIITL